jgi:site-specific DNA-methyltransferase (adenine-specific)
MKPLDGTIAHNAETWGVAGMNIDACRIGDNPGYKYNADRNGTTFHGKQGERIKQSAEKKGSQFIESTKGRWPANLLLDEKAAAQLDAQTGTLTSGKPSGTRKGTSGDSGIYGSDANRTGSVLTGFGDTGGASRFFYCAKATKKERGEDNDHPTVKPLALMDYLLTLLSTPTGGVVLDPFAGSGSTLVAAKRLGRECIGVELDVHNCDIAVSRLNTTSR